MSFLDKIASAVMPPESDEDRANARRVAEAMTSSGDWLSVVLDHHRQIETAFVDAMQQSDASGRHAAVERLAVLLTAHANAEESVLYPELADAGHKAHATMAYEEQAMTKVQMAKLMKLDPMGREWAEKLEHIRGAVLHHMYEEEGTWLPKLQQDLPVGERGRISTRFLEEFDRYVEGGRQDRRQSGIVPPMPSPNGSAQPGHWGAADF